MEIKLIASALDQSQEQRWKNEEEEVERWEQRVRRNKYLETSEDSMKPLWARGLLWTFIQLSRMDEGSSLRLKPPPISYGSFAGWRLRAVTASLETTSKGMGSRRGIFVLVVEGLESTLCLAAGVTMLSEQIYIAFWVQAWTRNLLKTHEELTKPRLLSRLWAAKEMARRKKQAELLEQIQYGLNPTYMPWCARKFLTFFPRKE